MNRFFVALLLIVSIVPIGCITNPTPSNLIPYNLTPTAVPNDLELDMVKLDFPDDFPAYAIVGTYSPFNESVTIEESRQFYLYSGLIPWAKEIRDTFDEEFIIFFSHGMVINDTWMCSIRHGQVFNVQEVADQLRERYPELPIVLIVCNPGHDTIYGLDIHYPKGNCWIVPDSDLPEHIAFVRRVEYNDEIVGSFADFTKSEE